MRSNVSVGTTPRQKWTACGSRTGVHSFDTRRTSVEMPSPSCISSVTSPFRKLPSAYSPSTAGPEIPLRKHCLLSGRTIDQSPLPCLRKRGIAAQVIRQFMDSRLLYEEVVHHNCVLVGKETTGQARYAGCSEPITVTEKASTEM